MSGPYDDIIDLPHPTSERHPRMPMVNRAAQFSPFAALTGYDAAVKETARLTDAKVELTEEEKSILDVKLQMLADRLVSQPTVKFTYFKPDQKKAGGAYLTVSGIVKKIDGLAGDIVLTDGQRISIENILDIQIQI